MLAFAQRAGPEADGEREAEWRAMVRDERDNIRAAVGWALTDGKLDTVVQIAAAVWPYWEMFGRLDEMHSWMVHTASGQLPAAPRAAALRLQGLSTGDVTEKRECWDAALLLYRELGDRDGIARCINNLGYLARSAGDYATAGALFKESLDMARAFGGAPALLSPLVNLALNALFQADFAGAQGYLDQHGTAVQTAGSVSGLAENRRLRGYVALRQGQYPPARRLLQEALEMARTGDDAPLIARCHVHLGYLALREGTPAQAYTLLTDGLRGFHEIGVMEGIQLALRGLAALAGIQRQPQRAARLFGAAEALRERIGIILPPVERPEYEEYVAAVRTGMSEHDFTAVWAEGRATSLDQAVGFALETTPC
jgi:tetratricopeptide (TPR) repeat protein